MTNTARRSHIKKTGKGTRNEKRCEDDLRGQGLVTWRVRRNRFANMDMFGLFDVVGWDQKRKELWFIQVKSNRVDKKTLENVRLATFGMPEGCLCQVWVWKDRQGWEKY
jgi:hypothetical protein